MFGDDSHGHEQSMGVLEVSYISGVSRLLNVIVNSPSMIKPSYKYLVCQVHEFLDLTISCF